MQKKIYLQEKEGKGRKVLEFIMEAVVTIVIALFIAKYVCYSVKTESKSMEPTVVPSSVVFVDKISYHVFDVERFDVVAFQRKDRNDERDILIRRVIGLPGESIRIERGVIYVNSRPLDVSKYGIGEITSDGIAGETMHLGEDEYFVLGDTPANSEDSRSSTIGVVHGSQLIGRAWLAARSITQISRVK